MIVNILLDTAIVLAIGTLVYKSIKTKKHNTDKTKKYNSNKLDLYSNLDILREKSTASRAAIYEIEDHESLMYFLDTESKLRSLIHAKLMAIWEYDFMTTNAFTVLLNEINSQLLSDYEALDIEISRAKDELIQKTNNEEIELNIIIYSFNSELDRLSTFIDGLSSTAKTGYNRSSFHDRCSKKCDIIKNAINTLLISSKNKLKMSSYYDLLNSVRSSIEELSYLIDVILLTNFTVVDKDDEPTNNYSRKKNDPHRSEKIRKIRENNERIAAEFKQQYA